MNSKKVAETSQETREWARAEYKAKTKDLIFTKDFQTRQEALMRDPLATVGERVMAWILRRSWGEYVLYAIKNDGDPAYQRDCAKDLGIEKRQVSNAVSYYQKRGYLDQHPKKLYPVISPSLAGPPPQKVTRSPDFLQFIESWKVTHSSDFQELEVARSTVERIRKVILSEYKKSRKTPQKIEAPSGVSLLEKSSKTSERILETEDSSSSAVASLSPAVQAEEEDKPRLYDRFKTQYPASHFDEAKAKPIFEGQTPTQQAHVLERLALYLSCDRWKDEDGRWIPLASNWLPICDADPPPVMKKKAAAAAAKKSYAESVREEAQRRLAKFGRI